MSLRSGQHTFYAYNIFLFNGRLMAGAAMKTQPAIIDAIAKRIGNYSHVEKVILFGSRARGDEQERSDIDIAVVGPEITRTEWVRMSSDVDDAETLLSIDLVRFETASSQMKDSIVKEGVILYERQ